MELERQDNIMIIGHQVCLMPKEQDKSCADLNMSGNFALLVRWETITEPPARLTVYLDMPISTTSVRQTCLISRYPCTQ